MSERQRSRVLVVTPGFHGYGASIGRALERRGFDVTVHVYDAVATREKAWNKLRYELPARLRGREGEMSGQKATRRALDRIRQVRPDLVLTIRGDILGPEFWQEAASAGRHSVLWLYDELRRMHFDVDEISHLAAVASYSALDTAAMVSRGIEARHLPNGFDPTITPEGTWPADPITFIGARYPGREAALDHLWEAGIPVMAYGRFWSRHPLDRLRTWRLSAPSYPSGRDTTLGQAYGIMRDGAATLNIHRDQDGFTMRTFEACGVGGVQIIDRDDVAELYDPGTEVLVYHDLAELDEVCRRVLADPSRMSGLRERARRRTLAEHTVDHRVRVIEEMW
ncbi:CgeB family protein [Acidipropionibacterium acidipropionici]|uniref:CgeB family protein n=1 Tax=Acidipropionibacterium acidipropionici TaxID=1748 RepID=UPI001E623E41|nr:glycosyltransferase [Acidipropionibacterium acidipropionici]